MDDSGGASRKRCLPDATVAAAAAASAAAAAATVLDEPMRVASWMYEDGPREGDLLQLQWMRADTTEGPTSSEHPAGPLGLRFALAPFALDPRDLLPPLLVDLEALDSGGGGGGEGGGEGGGKGGGGEAARTPAGGAATPHAPLRALAHDILAALASRRQASSSSIRSGGATGCGGDDLSRALARADALRGDEWEALLATSPLSAGLSVGGITALLRGLAARGGGSSGAYGGGAGALARELMRPDSTALVQALRHSNKRGGCGGGGGGDDGDDDNDDEDDDDDDGEDDENGSGGARARSCGGLARALLRASPALAASPVEAFQVAVRALELRERAGEPGGELETCLCEVYFGT
jgi:hypothetical protein